MRRKLYSISRQVRLQTFTKLCLAMSYESHTAIYGRKTNIPVYDVTGIEDTQHRESRP
jgi:hypothetical protein